MFRIPKHLTFLKGQTQTRIEHKTIFIHKVLYMHLRLVRSSWHQTHYH